MPGIVRRIRTDGSSGSRRRRAVIVVVSCLAGLGALAAVIAGSGRASPIRADEQVAFFPTYAVEGAGSTWIAEIHGWIYEPARGQERDTMSALLREMIRGRFGLSAQTMRDDVPSAPSRFDSRIAPFLVDNERNKRVAVTVAGVAGVMDRAEKSGHFSGRVTLPPTAGRAGGWVPVRAALPSGDTREFAGKVQLVPRTGISVISDIDDTIKHSQVRDKVQLGLNTFVRDFTAVPGMATLYQRWARDGQAVFHYVSGSPFQMYEALADFARRDGFPDGSVHLRTFRLKDRSALAFFGDPKAFKLDTIRPILRQFRERRFTLVGDSGEHDPEVYATLASEFENVQAILIRDVTDETLASPRYAALFADLPARVQRRVFRQTSELDDFMLR